MNTRKQVLLMSALLLIALLIVGVYGAWYPYREVSARDHFEEQRAERGSILFARNCRLCHGDVGEGGALGARLPAAPALDRADLQGFIDSDATLAADVNASATTIRVSNAARFTSGAVILVEDERMEVKGADGNDLRVSRAVGHTQAASHTSGATVQILDAATLAERSTLTFNTIACGRVGTAMPFWAQEHGGPLSDEQIEQLLVLITQGRWDLVEHHVDDEDQIASRLLGPLDAEATRIQVSDVRAFTTGEAIRIGEERLRVTAAPRLAANATNVSGSITVERGILGTTPFEHPETEQIFRFPEAPAEPSITQISCGQIARPPAPAGTPGLIEPFDGQTVEIVALGIAFDLDEITVQAGGQVRLRLDNRDSAVDHNIAVYESATNLTPVSAGSVGLTFPGPGIDDTVFDIPDAGSYFFRCDVHPTTMTGDFIVQ